MCTGDGKSDDAGLPITDMSVIVNEQVKGTSFANGLSEGRSLERRDIVSVLRGWAYTYRVSADNNYEEFERLAREKKEEWALDAERAYDVESIQSEIMERFADYLESFQIVHSGTSEETSVKSHIDPNDSNDSGWWEDM